MWHSVLSSPGLKGLSRILHLALDLCGETIPTQVPPTSLALQFAKWFVPDQRAVVTPATGTTWWVLSECQHCAKASVVPASGETVDVFPLHFAASVFSRSGNRLQRD